MKRIALVAILAFLSAAAVRSQDKITVNCSQDAYGTAAAAYSLTIDGTSVTKNQACPAANSPPGTPPATLSSVSFTGSWGNGAHAIKITFLNDAYGGSSATDRNLYVWTVVYDGTTLPAPTLGASSIALPPSGAEMIRTNDFATWNFAGATSATLDAGASTFTTTLSGYGALSKCSTVPCTSRLANTSGTPTVQVVIPTGTHTAKLTWSASTTSTVTSYNIYRGTADGGPYTLITTVSAPTLTYTDAAVASGSTYYYVVTAVDPTASPTESVYSNQVSAVIP